MESLSIGLSPSPAILNHPKTHKPNSNATPFIPNTKPINSNQTHLLSSMKTPLTSLPKLLIHKSNPTRTPNFPHRLQNNPSNLVTHSFLNSYLKSHLSFLCVGLYFPLPCFASDPIEEVSNRINVESILVSIDDFFNRNPFFVAGVTFIWLVVIPLTEEYLQKYKFISAIDAFRKLRDDPNSQLLDIRDSRSLRYLGSPNLKIVDKGVVKVEFREGDEDGFVKMVLEKFTEPANTVICVLDNFDGNSMKVAELLYKGGFKEAYAIRGGVRGNKGWQEIQETLLPPSVHINPKKKVQLSEQLEMNGGVVNQQQQQSSN